VGFTQSTPCAVPPACFKMKGTKSSGMSSSWGCSQQEWLQIANQGGNQLTEQQLTQVSQIWPLADTAHYKW